MSAGDRITERSPGWPTPGPATGYCKVPHVFFERVWRVCATPVEVGVLMLVIDQTVGYQRSSADLALGWIADRLGVTERAVRGAIEAAESRGLLIRERSGRHNTLSVDITAIADAPDYERPERQEPVREKPVKFAPVRISQIRYKGRVLIPRPGADLLTTDGDDSEAVAQCGECQAVGVFPLIPCSHLEFISDEDGEETAKDEPQFRFRGSEIGEETAKEELQFRFSADLNGEQTAKDELQFRFDSEKIAPTILPTVPPKGPAPNGTPSKRGRVAQSTQPSPRLKSIHSYLSMWRDAFHGTPPTFRQAAAIEKVLGDAPISYLEGVMRSRARWLHEKADHYGAIRPLAIQAREAWEADEGVMCPGGHQKLKADEICSQCGPESLVNPAPKLPSHKNWDAIQEQLRERLGDVPYQNWLARAGARQPNGPGSIEVLAADATTAEWLADEYGEVIAELLGPLGVTSIAYRAVEPVEVAR